MYLQLRTKPLHIRVKIGEDMLQNMDFPPFMTVKTALEHIVSKVGNSEICASDYGLALQGAGGALRQLEMDKTLKDCQLNDDVCLALLLS